MNERIHRVLDGELPRDMLSPAERTLLAEYEAMIAAAEGTLDAHIPPDLTDAVMSRIAHLPAPSHATPATAPAARDEERAGAASGFGARIAGALDWLWSPRPVTVRPAWGLAAAALVGALIGVGPLADEAPVDDTAVTAAAAPAVPAIYVSFRLDAPNASSVHLAGDFTDWQPRYELHETQPGVWSVVVPLEAGVHDYAFVVDGEHWTPDPLATRVDDGFGGENSRLSLLPPERMRA